MTLAHATVEELRDAAQREERMDRARRFFAQKVRKTETVYHDELPLTAERTVYERPDGAAFVDDLLALLAALPALLDRLERAEREREEAADLLRANGGLLRKRLERVEAAAREAASAGDALEVAPSVDQMRAVWRAAVHCKRALRAALDDEAPR